MSYRPTRCGPSRLSPPPDPDACAGSWVRFEDCKPTRPIAPTFCTQPCSEAQGYCSEGPIEHRLRSALKGLL